MTHPHSCKLRPGSTVHPLGPLAYRVASLHPWRARLLAAGVCAGCLAVLSIAAGLTPARAGLGSHRQLGLGPCPLVTLVGYPCPTCGMTTAFAHTVRGQLGSAFHAQPAGFLLALGTAAAAALSAGVLFTGKVWAVNWYRVPPTLTAVAILLCLLAGWGYKLATGVISGTLPVGR